MVKLQHWAGVLRSIIKLEYGVCMCVKKGVVGGWKKMPTYRRTDTHTQRQPSMWCVPGHRDANSCLHCHPKTHRIQLERSACVQNHTHTHTHTHTLVVALPAPLWGVWGCNKAPSPFLPRPSPSLLCPPPLGTQLVVPREGDLRASSATQRTRPRPQHVGYRCLWRD